MALMDCVNSPADLQKFSYGELKQLAGEIRAFLVENVTRTGGHLGPNLGVVELTIAIHRVFNGADDVILFDVGHQTYVHKILTGRKDFTHLREPGGISGYASRNESEHDVIENSHASTALSWADGIARGRQIAGNSEPVVAVIGDGALTGGMAWEALNNIAEAPERPLVIVINDNGRSYAPTVGGFVRRLPGVRRLDNMRVDKRYEDLLRWGERTLKRAGKPGKLAYNALHGLKHGLKDVLFDAGIFDTLNIKYLGPVDGHNIAQLEEALAMAKNYGRTVVVHTITDKGRGYKPAEADTVDHFHAVGKIHPETGLPVVKERFGWTAVVADELLTIAREDPQLVGITAAMLLPVGLGPMQEKFPERVFDVGIAEQHAVTMAAGLAYAGFHPVVALYATFLNRAFDQVLMDIALHQENVTILLDRAGVTGSDGPSHNGVWDLAMATEIPGLRVAIPRDAETLRRLLREAICMSAPTLIRYPKGRLPANLPAIRRDNGYAVLAQADCGVEPMLAIGFGPMAHTVMAAAQECSDIPVTVVDPEWALPLPKSLVDLAARSSAVVTLEDGLVAGGIGAELAVALNDRGVNVPMRNLGIRKGFITTGRRSEILREQGMDVCAVSEAVRSLWARVHRSYSGA